MKILQRKKFNMIKEEPVLLITAWKPTHGKVLLSKM